MKPNDKGSYCDLCSKTVIDFTKLNQVEISEAMRKSGNKICARVTSTQLNSPLISSESPFELTIPKPKVAASLALAASLTIGHASHAENHFEPTEFVQSTDEIIDSKRETSASKLSEPELNELAVFKGKVISEDLKQPIENAKITLVTTRVILSTYTLATEVIGFEF
jgi:hypothetical protein